MKPKNKDTLYAILALSASFLLFLAGIFIKYPDKIFYFSAAIILFFVGDYFIARRIMKKKLKEMRKLNDTTKFKSKKLV